MKKFYLLLAIVLLVNTLWSQVSMIKVTNPFLSTKVKVITSNKLNAFNRNILKRKQLQNIISGDAIEKLDSMVAINCNDSNNLTTPNYKHVNTFDNTGNLIVDSEYNWSADLSTYIFGIKNEYTYDIQGRILTDTEFCDSYELKNEYTYNKNGKDSILMEYSLDPLTNPWMIDSKTEYNYSGSNIQTEMYYDWNSSANGWELDSKTFHYFDSYKNDTLVKAYENYNNNWTLSDKQINHYTYNEAGIKTAKINYDISYNSDSTTIGSAEKDEFTYDNDGNTLTRIISDYNSNTENYDLFDKYEFGYDISKNLSEVLMGNLNGFECNNKLIDYKYYTYADSEFKLAGKVNFYYSNITIQTGNAQISNHSFSVSPNPATEYVKFNAPESEGKLLVAIINLQGKTVLEKQVENDAPVNVKGLNKGLYMFKVTDNKSTYNGKLIVK